MRARSATPTNNNRDDSPDNPEACNPTDGTNEQSVREVVGSFALLGRMDTAEQVPKWILRTASGRYVKISKSAHLLLGRVQEGLTFKQIAQGISEATGKAVEARQIRVSVCKIVSDVGAGQKRAQAKSPFLLKLTLLPEPVVALLGIPLSKLFNPWAVVGVLMLFPLGAVMIWPPFASSDLSASTFAGGYGFFLLGMLFHELGHGSATVRFGARPSMIGFTVYLVFPALFCDVTSVWTLKRWERVVVDIGGMYFQLIFCLVGSVVYYFTQWQTLHVGCWIVVLSLFVNLNPVFKFDGYWVVSDLLGVANLGEHRGKMLADLFGRLRGKRQVKWPWPRWTAVTMALYSVGSTAFLVYFFSRFVPNLWATIVRAPEVLFSLANNVLQQNLDGFVDNAGDLLQTAFVLLVSVLVFRRLQRIFAGFCHRWLRHASTSA
jgi:putative peptide zinc metalloprotease protein